MFLIGCARGSCARGYNVCDMHAQIMRQSAAVRKQQQHVEFALRDKHVVTPALANCLQLKHAACISLNVIACACFKSVLHVYTVT